MEENLNINELIELKQLPVIFYELEQIGKIIDTQLDGIENMEVTEENKTEVKKRRAEINNLNTAMENKRKEIKKKILADYELFNEKYENEIKTKLVNASNTLKTKIDDIENKQLAEKNERLKEFFNEYVKNLHLETIVDYETMQINVTLSASEKSLKEAIKSQLEEMANDLKLIALEHHRTEILFEYKKNGHDYAKAKLLVMERIQKMQELEVASRQADAIMENEKKIEESVDEIVEPIEIVEEVPTNEISDNQVMIYTFTVTGTREEIISVRDFLKERGIQYE